MIGIGRLLFGKRLDVTVVVLVDVVDDPGFFALALGVVQVRLRTDMSLNLIAGRRGSKGFEGKCAKRLVHPCRVGFDVCDYDPD
jgi:hypothetical protein